MKFSFVVAALFALKIDPDESQLIQAISDEPLDDDEE